jgi:hypothetical protein
MKPLLTALAALFVLLASCANTQGSSTLDKGDPSGDTGAAPAGYAWAEGFESGLPGAPWAASGSISALAALAASVHGGGYSAAFQSLQLYRGESLSLTRSLKLTEAANLRFWLRTDIGSDSQVATDFTFELDGVVVGTWNGLGGAWKAVDTIIPAGAHSLRWKLTKNSNYYYNPPVTNNVYLDDVSLCPDTAAAVALDSAAPQEVVAGGKLSYAARALRADGSVKADAPVSWELSAGADLASVSQDGILSAAKAGSASLRALAEGIASAASAITIMPADYLDLPVAYAGASYAGRAAGGSGPALIYADPRVSVSSPSVGSFSADGFFTLRGKVTGTGATRYAFVAAQKVGGTTEERSLWFVQGDFALRLWLRFGPGVYTVDVYPATVSANLNFEGDIESWSYSSRAYAFSVTNTRQEDGRFLYPSDELQSDDLSIRNLSARLVFGASGDRDRLKALHDYVVSTLHYDFDSLATDARKKQDALSALANGTGVCEGYTSLFGALARAAGYRAKAVAGTVDGGNHAWNLVELDGAWPMIDCTWDDPVPRDTEPASVAYDYFLASGPNGDLHDHAWTGDRPSRSLLGVTNLVFK